MKRYAEETSRIHREWKKHWLSHVEQNLGWSKEHPYDPFEIDCSCDTQKGRFRKRKAFDCGNTECYICHSDKYPKRDITYQEWISDLKFKEGLEEVHGEIH